MSSQEDYLEWTNFFKGFKYKPNWKFDLRFEGDPRIPSSFKSTFSSTILHITMLVPDSRWQASESIYALGGMEAYVRSQCGHMSSPKDAMHPLIEIGLERSLPLWSNKGEAQYLMRQLIQTMEVHEMDEWISIDGELPFDPHKKSEF